MPPILFCVLFRGGTTLLRYVRLAVVYALLRITLLTIALYGKESRSLTHTQKSVLSGEAGVPPKRAPLIQKPDTSLSTKAWGLKVWRANCTWLIGKS